MKTTRAFSLAFAVCSVWLAHASAAGTDLFNGKDFTGWTFYERGDTDPKNTWSVSDGLVHCTGTPNGYMRTEKKYSDYKVTVEWRFQTNMTRAVNTGVCVFMEDRATNAPANAVWPNCIECQGMHDHQGDFWLQGGAKCDQPTTQGPTGIKMLKPSAEKPPGEWNTFEVICKGNTVEIIVNGVSMNKNTGCNNSTGYIGLQSEGGPWEARKVALEPLP